MCKETFVSLYNMQYFDTFWKSNGHALHIERDLAFQLCMNCSLLIGSGAAPLIRVGFADEDVDF